MKPTSDGNEYELLIDLDQEEFLQKYRKVTGSMPINNDWYYIKGSYKGNLPIDFKNAVIAK